MACLPATDIDCGVETESESDYGSDFSLDQEQLITHLLAERERVEILEDYPIFTVLEYHEQAQTDQVPRVLGREQIYGTLLEGSSIAGAKKFSSVAFDSENPDLYYTEPRVNENISGSNTLVDDELDTRSPIERFRTAPRKPLSVTDLVSPAWCELQYWYSLRKHGKKLQTKAMREGSVVHKELEEQVHTTVRVKIATREDAWGLRIWNVIQGLRTLQEIGYTRELEVWGIVDGFVVNGIIDEISFACPDAELEARLEKAQKSDKEELPADQTTISEFFRVYSSTSITDSLGSKKPILSTRVARKIYICDVKTRTAQRLPTGAAFRPTKMQLMLYHHLLSGLATNQVELSILLDRYDLDGERPFSDSFMAQVGSLNDGTPADSVPDHINDACPFSSQDSITILQEHNSLRRLWSLMIKRYQYLLPDGKNSIGNVLRAEYRSRDDGDILGSSTLAMNDKTLQVYLDHEMKWWKGEREPLGVVIEEAYKCKSCDFADICDWRRERVAEAIEKARANKKALRELKKWVV